MYRAIRAASRLTGRAGRSAQSSGGTKQMRFMLAAAPTTAPVWPAVQPSVAASTTAGTSKTNTAAAVGSSDSLIDLLEGDDDETRFKARKFDRGPQKERRESARGSFATFTKGEAAGGGGGQRRVKLDDLLTGSGDAAEGLDPEMARYMRASSEGAVEVAFPYDEEVSPVAVAKSVAPRPLPSMGGDGGATIKDGDFYAGEDSGSDGEGGEEEGAGAFPLVVEREVRTLDARETKFILQSVKDDAEYTGPTMHAVVDGRGGVLPLLAEDAERLGKLQSLPPRSIPPALWADPNARAAIVLRATLQRRAVRATYGDEGMARIAAAVALQRGDSDATYNARPSPFASRRDTAYRAGQDPVLDKALPFDPRVVTFVSNMTWNASPNAQGVDRRAVLTAKVSGLGLSPAALTWMQAIASTRYEASTGQLRLASEAQPTSGGNKRVVLEALVALVREANKLSKAHGPLPRRKAMPKYAQA